MAPAAKRKRPVAEEPVAEEAEEDRFLVEEDVDSELEGHSDDSDGAEIDPDELEDDDEEAKFKRSGPSTSLYRLPTAAELKGFRDASLLYKSPLFQLQLEELLKQVTPDYTKLDHLESMLKETKALLDKPMESISLSVPEALAWAAKNKVTIPFTESVPLQDVKYKLASASPAGIAVIGSFLLRHICRTADQANVDLAVEMPASLFQEKDFVNHRYFQKKAFYLASVAAHIRRLTSSTKKPGAFKPELAFHAADGDRRRPVLLLREQSSPSTKSANRFVVRLHPVISTFIFPLPSLGPTRCNIRKGDGEQTSTGAPTPHYNNAILADIFAISHLNVLHVQRKSCPSFDAAAILGRSWLSRRGFSGENGGFGGFLWSMVMDFLLRGGGASDGKVPGANCSPYQLFRVTLEFLADRDFVEKPVFMTDKFEPLKGADFSRESFKSAFDVVMVDPSGMMNLASRMSVGSLRELQREARRTLDLLNDGLQDHFSDIFPIRSVSEGLLKWDELFTAKPVVEFSDPVAAADSLDALLFSIPSLLRDALGSRAEVIDVRKLVRTKEWPISAQWTDTNDLAEQRLLVGCVLSEETVGVVEHGPSSEDADGARKFKSVWGELADLRRFRDGSIRYSVVWEPPKYPDNAAEGGWGWVLRRAIPHLLKRHFGMAETAIYNAKIDSALKALHDEQVAPGEAFDELSKRLRALENLPLSVLSVALASSSTVKCDPARYLLPKGSQPPMEVIIEFEHTSRWPDDLEAIQKMKLAFGLRIAEQFRLQFSGTASSVGGFGEDAGASDPSLARILAHSYVDIVTERGLAFRCRLLVERERHLLETALASPLTAAETKPSLEQALERYRTLYVNAPYHALHLHNRCTEFPGLAWTICLAKLWLARHLLSLHFSDELVELVCLSLYTNPGPNALPKSGAGGFLRFLERLADWDWRNDPLIVELHKGELTPAVRTSIEAAFKSLRASAANTARTAMFAATEVEVGSRQHSFSNPSWVILDRARMLARSGVALVSSSIRDGNPDKLKGLFSASLKDYDALIHLDARLVGHRSDAADSQGGAKRFKNIALAKQQEGVRREVLNPTMAYCRDLQRSFHDVALFFADRYAGTVIGVVWNPLVVRRQAFRVSTPFASRPDGSSDDTDGKATVVPDKEALVAEMLRVGGQLAVQVSLK